jgi:pentafunctional AROM polypeptide
MDDELERSEGMTIPEMLKDNDWEGFRRRELNLLKRLMKEKPTGYIFATGGGIVETPEARQLLNEWQKDGTVLHISRDIKTVMEFLQIDKTRPAYMEDMMGVYLRRRPCYEECSNLHFHCQTIDLNHIAARWANPLDNFNRFLDTSFGRNKVFEEIRAKQHSFFISLTSPTIERVVPLLPEVTVGVDAVELRADLLVDGSSSNGLPTPEFLTQQIALLRASTSLPLIFTLRTVSQGGHFPDEDIQGAKDLYTVATRMGFEFIDVELSSDPELKKFILDRRRSSVIIASHHDPKGELSWADSGADWIPHYDAAREYGDIVKLIGTARSTIDNDDLKNFKRWAAEERADVPVIAMNMGDLGKMSRVTNRFMTPVSHPSLPFVAAPGQISAADIRKVLSLVGEISPKVFCLFGKPIQQSRSPALHNALFKATGLPHSYVLRESDHVSHEVDFIRSPSFGGASVTIPHKLDIMDHLDTVDEAAKAIGAVNTIVPSKGPGDKTILTGYNTDWQGIVLSLHNAGAHPALAGTPEAGLVVGGGGTARAAIYALKSMGYSPIYLIGRNALKLGSLAASFPQEYNIRLLSSEAEVGALAPAQFPSAAIGTIPGDAPIDSTTESLLDAVFQGSTRRSCAAETEPSKRILLEMAYKPAVTPLMSLAARARWVIIPGLEALVGQGVHQFKLWTGIMPLYEFSRQAVMGNEA